MTPGCSLDLERQHRVQLRLGEAADVALAVVGVANRLLRQACDRVIDLLPRQSEVRRVPFIELATVLSNRVHAIALQIEQHAADGRCRFLICLEKALLAFFDDFHPVSDYRVGEAVRSKIFRSRSFAAASITVSALTFASKAISMKPMCISSQL